MSHFLCICPPTNSIETLRKAFGEKIWIEDVTECAIGQVMPGGKQGRSSYFLQAQSQFDSFSLLYASRKNDDPQMLLNGLEKLASQVVEPIYLLFHIYRGSLTDEEVIVAKNVLLPFDEFKILLPKMEENVKYKIMLS